MAHIDASYAQNTKDNKHIKPATSKINKQVIKNKHIAITIHSV